MFDVSRVVFFSSIMYYYNLSTDSLFCTKKKNHMGIFTFIFSSINDLRIKISKLVLLSCLLLFLLICKTTPNASWYGNKHKGTSSRFPILCQNPLPRIKCFNLLKTPIILYSIFFKYVIIFFYLRILIYLGLILKPCNTTMFVYIFYK